MEKAKVNKYIAIAVMALSVASLINKIRVEND